MNRPALGRREDLVIAVTTCLRPYEIADAQGDDRAQPHDWARRRRALTAALAALSATAPLAASAPARTPGLWETSDAIRPDVRVILLDSFCHRLLR